MSPTILSRHFRCPLSRLLKNLRLPLHLHWGFPSRRAPHKQCNAPAHSLRFLSQELDFLPSNDHSTPPKSLVDAVRNLKRSLPTGCELLGQGDLEIIGPLPIAAGGSADVWIGERNGTTVVVKAYRYYASSSCLPVYLVSGES